MALKFTSVILIATVSLAFLARKSSQRRRYDCINRDDLQEDSIPSSNLEVYSRLDYLQCSGVRMPRQNQYTIHLTNLKLKGSDIFCEARLKFKSDIPIENVAKIIRFIRSPGYTRGLPYKNNVLAYYNISCGEGNKLTLHFLCFNLQDKIQYDNEMLCVDYVNISSSDLGDNQIYCGKNENMPSIEVQSGNALVTFRTSRVKNHKGFEMSAICSVRQDTGSAAALCKEKKEQAITVDSSQIKRLLHLYKTFTTTTHLVSGASYKEMLTLAVRCESACDPVVKTVGSEVLKHIPDKLIAEYRHIASIAERMRLAYRKTHKT